MTVITTYDAINHDQWSALIRDSATGTWFQSPDAYRLYASLPELLEAFAFALVNEPKHGLEAISPDALRGVCVGYLTQEPSAAKQWFTRRAIIVGGPCLADDSTDEEVKALMVDVREHLKTKAIYIETRNFNDYSRWREAFTQAGFAYRPHLNFHLDCCDKTRLWEQLSDNRKRQIRKSEKTQVTVLDPETIGEAEIRMWYQSLQQLYRTKVKTPLWPLEFFLEAHKQGVGKYMLVSYNDKVIGGSMVVADSKSVYEWFECGLNAEYKDQYPSVMATWAGIQWTNTSALQRYDMMGAGEPGVAYGVREFKAEFGGTMVEHGRFLCICRPWLYRLGKAGVTLLRAGAKA